MAINVNINLDKVFDIVLHEEKKEEKEVKDTTEFVNELDREGNHYRYPLTMSQQFPAYITFRAFKVEGADFREALGDIGSGTLSLLDRGLRTVSPAYAATSAVADRVKSTIASDASDTSEADGEMTAEEKAGVIGGANKIGQALESYSNLQKTGEEVGSVTLPLQRSLQFNDAVTYNEANLGIAGASAGALLQGQNPFEGVMGSNGRLSRAAAGIASQKVAENAASIVAGAIGSKLGGATGGLFAFGAAGDVGSGIGTAIQSATRVTTNPNQRTLFENVRLRDFSFTFKLIANNAKESREVKNIVKFFRQELYPESITSSSGVPLAYEFPNVFEIEIKNFKGDAPAPKIQRCYLQSVQTNYNSTANSMRSDGSFVEVDITLNFKEIVALNKNRVREEDY